MSLHPLNWFSAVFVLGFTAGFTEAIRSAEPVYPLTVVAGEHARSSTLIEWSLPEVAPPAITWELVDEQGAVTPTQLLLGQPRRIVWKLSQPLLAGQSRKYTLRPASILPADSRPKMTPGPGLHHAAGRLSLFHADKEILTYHTGTSQPPDGIAAQFARSGHIHPLRTPSGKLVTAEFPADHAHQHGVFMAWVHTQFAGHEVDFWNQGKQSGDVRHRRLVESRLGPVYSGFVADLEHLDLTQGEVVVLHESWRVMAFKMADMYLLDIESLQTAATDEPLKVLKYHYGGFGWRGPSEWLLPSAGSGASGCDFLTSEGHDRLGGNHTRPQWVSVTGLMSGELCTVTIFGHHFNLHHPQPVRLHPDKPYFCFAPCVWGEFSISRDKPLNSRYRIITHDGGAQPERYDALVRDWATPPGIRVEHSYP